MKIAALISLFFIASELCGQSNAKLPFATIPSNDYIGLPGFVSFPAAADLVPLNSVFIQSGSNLSEVSKNSPAIIPEDFQALRPINFLDRIYFGGSNDLLGLRPIAIAQQRMPDPMLKNLQTLYIRSSIGLKNHTRLVIHCECLLFIKTMSNMAFLLPQLGLRQRF